MNKNNDIVRYQERERFQLLRYGADLGCSKRGEITTELQGGKCRNDANVIFSTGES
jgi:NAD-specific glutamate dehydrogenase